MRDRLSLAKERFWGEVGMAQSQDTGYQTTKKCMRIESLSWGSLPNTPLVDNKTWHFVPHKIVRNFIDWKWVYRIKRKVDATIDRYKARLVEK